MRRPLRPRAWWRQKNRSYYAELECLASAAIPAGARVLEAGCGIGDLLAAARPAFGIGLDASLELVQVARERHGRRPASNPGGSAPLHLAFVCGDAQALPFAGPFDYVICSDLFGQVADVQVALDELQTVCGPHTRVFITHWNFLWRGVLWLAERTGQKMPEAQPNWLRAADVENLLYLADFAVVERGWSLLCPKDVPLVAPLLNRWAIRLPGARRLALVQHWLVQAVPPTRKPERLSCSVIVPCRNEAGNIAGCVARLPALGTHTELIFVDGASTDGTRERILEQIERYAGKQDIKLLDQVPPGGAAPAPAGIAPFAATTAAPVRVGWSRRPGTDEVEQERAGAGGRRKGAAVKMLPLGKGDAVRKGFAAASGDVLVILDADLTVPPEELPKFFDAIATGKADFVNGTRLVYPLENEAMRPLNLLGNKLFSVVFTWLLGRRLADTLCGTKALRKRDYQRMAEHRGDFDAHDPFGDFDLLFGAARLGLRIVEVPVRYRRRTSGVSKVQVLKHGWQLLRLSLAESWRLRLARRSNRRRRSGSHQRDSDD